MVVIAIILIIAGLAFIGYSCLAASAPDEEQLQQEDEEQIEYIRKWREEHDKN